MSNSAVPVLATLSYDRLLQLARQRTFEASGGLLNDSSDAGVLTALLKAQSGAIADENAVLNSLVDVAVLKFLEALGIAISPGVQSRVFVTLILNQVSPVPVIIPKLKISRNGIPFFTGGSIEVAAGLGTIEIIAVAAVYGTAGNVSPGDWQILTPHPLVQSVISTVQAEGGEDPEDLATIPPQELIDRLAAGSLTRTSDFEREARKLLGDGSAALAIGKLGADKSTKELGAVHVFGLNPDGSELTADQIVALQLALDQGSPLATIHVSSMVVERLRAYFIVMLAPNADGAAVAATIWAETAAYIHPSSLPPGQAVYVNELVVLAGNVVGVDRVQSAMIGEFDGVAEPDNQSLSFAWSVPRVDVATVECVFGKTTTAYYFTRETS